jgi:hypothetical protein
MQTRLECALSRSPSYRINRFEKHFFLNATIEIKGMNLFASYTTTSSIEYFPQLVHCFFLIGV